MTYEESPDEFGFYPEQYCRHGNPDGVYCDQCHEEEDEGLE